MAFLSEAAVVARLAHGFEIGEQALGAVVVARRPMATLQEVWPELGGRN